MSKIDRSIDSCRKALKFLGESRKSPGNAIVHNTSTGKSSYSRSPAATGKAATFKMGKTGSGKEITSHSHTSGTHSWGPKDHLDAYSAHAKHVAQLDPERTHPKLIEHHQAAMQHHYSQAFPNFKKSLVDILWKAHPHGVIGKTRSGKKVYHHHHHHSHGKFTKEDHKDAAHLHHKKNMKIMEKMKHAKGKMKAALHRLLHKHQMGVHVHGHAHHSKGA